MRKNLAIFQASPRRLLTLLLIASLIASTLESVVEGELSELDQRKIEIKHCYQSNIKYSAKLQLFNKCSNKLVTFSPHKAGKSGANVEATGLFDDLLNSHKTILNIKSFMCNVSFWDPPVLVRIMLDGTQESLCFRKSGKLFKKDAFVAQCAFTQEKMDDRGFGGEVRYRSALYPEFYIGFDSKGKALRGQNLIGTWREPCTHFSYRLEEDFVISDASKTAPKHKIRHGKDSQSKLRSKSSKRKRRKHRRRLQRLERKRDRLCGLESINSRRCQKVKRRIAKLRLS